MAGPMSATPEDSQNAQPVHYPHPLTPELVELLQGVATATLTAQLQRRGIRNTFFTGLEPIKTGQRLLGTAKTLRYVPMREDLMPVLQAGINAQRRAVESIGAGQVLVIEARNSPEAGTIGDVLSMRALARGATGIITDGCVRDSAAVQRLDIPVYLRAPHAATLSRDHLPLDIDIPIACAGVLVMPGDVIVGDDDGAMLIPAALVEEVARDAAEQEMRDAWAFERVAAGDSTVGVFPIAADRMAEYETWKTARG
jgi:5-oxopent-3-ene-1,2,5-tricarboxylate decarboxylase / 2-hydroxyhepta-2,4-diene-1,7-dioate isomerase